MSSRMSLSSHRRALLQRCSDSGRHFTLADLGLAYTWRKVRLTLDWTNILGARLYSSGTLSDLVAAHSYYDIRPSAIMLKARFKLF